MAAAAGSTFVATQVSVLFQLAGNQTHPVRDIVIENLTLRDAAATFMEPHGMPSGGDWTLQHSGAVTATGAESLDIKWVDFVRNDGNSVLIGAYARNVSDSGFSWQGDSCVASWGVTSRALNSNGTRTLPLGIELGPDARGGNHPLGTRLLRNTAHDIGLWQKQSSFYFTAVSAMANVSGNVMWNAPRAWINANDGMGGGDDFGHNVLVNAVRESGDHGP